MSEIIIEGVNVAECVYIENEHCLNYLFGYDCKDNPQCYYKRWQRLEAEKQEKVLKMAEAEVEIEKLQAENERLKNRVEELDKMTGIFSYRLMEKYRKARGI